MSNTILPYRPPITIIEHESDGLMITKQHSTIELNCQEVLDVYVAIHEWLIQKNKHADK